MQHPKCCTKNLTVFKFDPTCCNISQQGGQTYATCCAQQCCKMKGVVSKETVVLRRWGSSIQKFGFINGVDNVNWPPYRDSKS